MQFVSPGIPFSFTYPTSDQTSSLYVRANIYDVTTGTPVFVTNQVMIEIAHGYYFGNFTAGSGKVYLVVASVYTNNTYSTLDLNRAPWADIYKVNDSSDVLGGFNYGSFDNDTTLNVAGSVYNVTTGVAVFQTRVAMPHVYNGVYFGGYIGTLSNSYQVIKLVYTDNTFSIVDSDFPLGSEFLQFFSQNITENIFAAATLVGQKQAAILTALDQQAILMG